MGVYASDHPDVPGMQGLHLFHFALSNCSQRVRIALAEKGLAWTSHHLDMPNNEHVTSDYHRINPNAVVPTLVHDGQVVIESNDILTYLEEKFPDPRLTPDNATQRDAMQARIDEASAFQKTLKVLSHDRIFRPFRTVGDSEIDLYSRVDSNPDLVAFLRDYAEDGAAWKQRVANAEADLQRVFARLETALAEAPWFSGETYGLADISWVVNANRMRDSQVDLAQWPRLEAWLSRATSRPAYGYGVNWTPES